MKLLLRFGYLVFGFIVLLGSCILPSSSDYVFALIFGGILLMLAFAKLGSYDYRGVPSKLLYKIIRYILAILLAITLGIQIYIQVSIPDVVPYAPYATIVDIALISYLIMYKPSDSTPLKKVLKIIGYITISVGINALRNARIVVEYPTYTYTEINWGIILASVVVVIIGVTLLAFGGVKNSKAVKEKDIDNIQIIDVNL